MVTVTVLTTGLVSIRVHSERSEALSRLERRMERLERMRTEARVVSDAEVRATSEAISTFDGGVPRLIAYGNVGILAAVVLVAGNWMRQADWRYVWLDKPPPGYWALVVIVLAEASLVSIGILDLRRVVRDLRRRGSETFASRLGDVETHLAAGRIDVAREQAERLRGELPTALWPARLIGCGHLASSEWEQAREAFEGVMKRRDAEEPPEAGVDLVSLLGLAAAQEGLRLWVEAARLAAQAVASPEFARDGVPAFMPGPRRLDTWVRVVENLVDERDPVAASRALELLMRRHQTTPESISEGQEMMAVVVRSFCQQGEVAAARAALRRWSRIAPWLAQANSRLRRELNPTGLEPHGGGLGGGH
ncbi:MAG: hypothetical protein ACRDV9_02440 [Acidimicrobiia bacterium]